MVAKYEVTGAISDPVLLSNLQNIQAVLSAPSSLPASPPVASIPSGGVVKLNGGVATISAPAYRKGQRVQLTPQTIQGGGGAPSVNSDLSTDGRIVLQSDNILDQSTVAYEVSG